MNKNVNFFLIGFLISLPIFGGVNIFQKNLEDFLFLEKLENHSQLLMALVNKDFQLENLKPIRKKETENLEIKAESAISVLIKKDGSEKILFSKNSKRVSPIASITKLMTASVVLKYYDIDNPRIIQLLYPLLMESDNQAAENLAEMVGKEEFVNLMNLEAKKIGLTNTYFVNPTGLDQKNSELKGNFSSPEDLVKLAKYITTNQPLIWQISILKRFKDFLNNNKLLEEIPDIIGGKTGETPIAGQCLILLIRPPKENGFIVNVILNSNNRFEEMKRMIDWLKFSYEW